VDVEGLAETNAGWITLEPTMSFSLAAVMFFSPSAKIRLVTMSAITGYKLKIRLSKYTLWLWALLVQTALFLIIGKMDTVPSVPIVTP
jgi:hypothetical protein